MRSVELFSGAGGLALGTAKAGFKHELVVEWDSNAFATLSENQRSGVSYVKDWPIVQADVRDFDFSGIKSGLDLLAGGPPCQPFSVGGKHRGPNDHRDMWPATVRAVHKLAPRVFLFENVQGILRKSFAEYLRYITLCLEWPGIFRQNNEAWTEHMSRLLRHSKSNSCNESCLRYKIFINKVNTADYGAPQKRRRVILVGIRSDIDLDWNFPAPTHSREALLWSQWVTEEYWQRHGIPSNKRPKLPRQLKRTVEKIKSKLFAPKHRPWITVRDTICDLPNLQACGSGQNFPNHNYQPGARVYIGHTGSPLDEPAKALKAGDHGVPGGENMLVELSGGVRYFTVREAARLQGFPDSYIFPVAWSESMRQLGNAVPVQLALAVGQSLMDALLSYDLNSDKAQVA